jgi:hypothetical protein
MFLSFFLFLSLLVSLSVFEVYITSIAYFASDHCIFVTVIGGLEPETWQRNSDLKIVLNA